MSGCCGRRIDPPDRTRRLVTPESTRPIAPAAPAGAQAAAAGPAAAPAPQLRFRYIGSTMLRVIGPRSRRSYEFSHHGDECDVDPRDAPYLAAVPRLIKT